MFKCIKPFWLGQELEERKFLSVQPKFFKLSIRIILAQTFKVLFHQHSLSILSAFSAHSQHWTGQVEAEAEVEAKA